MKKVIAISVVIAALAAVLAYFLFSDTSDGSMKPTSAPEESNAALTPPSTGLPSNSPQLQANPDVAQAEEVAREALTVAFTWYPATDRSRTDAYARARRWLTDELSGTLFNGTSNERGPGLQWVQWASENAKVVADVAVGCSGCPPDTDTLLHRVASIHQTSIVDDKPTRVDPDTTVWVTLIKRGDQWLIDSINY